MIYTNLVSYGLPTQSEKCDLCGNVIKGNIDAYFLSWDERDDKYVRRVLNLKKDVDVLLICENCLWSEIREKISRKVKICANGKTIGIFVNGRYIERY